jgi:hypothetical protein
MMTIGSDSDEAGSNGWKYRVAAWGVIAVGVAVRVRVYLGNRSMERDEAALAFNIIHRGFFGLFKQLDRDQAAPIGFLMVQRLVVDLMGSGEKALRLFPLVASILALVLFWELCRRILTPRAGVIAVAILSLSAKQYFYASQTKQYSTDVLMAVGMLLVTHGWIWGRKNVGMTRRRMGVIAGCGAVAIWFSHPIIFVLAGIGVVGAWEIFRAADRRVREFLIVMGIWVFSFLINYVFILHRLSHDSFMQTFWSAAGAFAPAPKSGGSLIWYKKTFFDVFEDPLSLGFVGLAALFYLMGLLSWGRGEDGGFVGEPLKNPLPSCGNQGKGTESAPPEYRERGEEPAARREKTRAILAVMVLPIVFALGASVLHRFPFKSRMILFLTPLLAAGIGAGVDLVWRASSPQRWAGVLGLVLLMISPVMTSADYAKHPPKLHEMRDALAFVAANRQAGDVYYVYPFCSYALDYYKERMGLADIDYVRGAQAPENWDGWEKELAPFAGKRVWVFFEDPTDHGGVNDEQMAVRILSGMGREACRNEPYGEFVACYDLRH